MSEPPPPYAPNPSDGKMGQPPPPAGNFFSSKYGTFKRLFIGSTSNLRCQHPPAPFSYF